ncbi:MAG TPA: nickel transporter permease [Acidimicrobiales bacterium]|nr:nickel transporter permease [Acidimicrobiales bacterium]
MTAPVTPAAVAGPGGAVLAGEVVVPVRVGSRRDVVRSLLHDRTAVLGLAIVTVLVLGAVFAPLLAHHDPNHVDVLRKFLPPSRSFPLGTDNLGRDVFARILFGARVSIGTAILAGLAIGAIGTAVGLVAGYMGGVVDGLIGRVLDVLLSFPSFLLAMAVLGLVGPGLKNLVIATIAVSWAQYGRIVRGTVLVERERDYVEAARAAGASTMRVMRRHVLPNIVAPVIVLITLDMGIVLLQISGLSFLGLGVKPPTAEWGAMLSEGRNYLDQAPQMMTFPGAAIFLLVLGLNLLGDGLRDALDPRTRLRLAQGRRGGRGRGRGTPSATGPAAPPAPSAGAAPPG